MPYVVRGKIGAVRGNEARVGQFTYLAETGDCFYIWNGAHKASHFASVDAGLEAASQCNGSWFNAPDPATIGVVESAHCVSDALVALKPGGSLVYTLGEGHCRRKSGEPL
jgi:hypothetical protein